jgi:predicted GIY-YIG superfamily endonuclease
MWCVYILRCADNSLYVGETNNLADRLARHNQGFAADHIAKRRPVRMVYADEFASRAACLARERQLKPWTRAKKEALIAGDKRLLKNL